MGGVYGYVRVSSIDQTQTDNLLLWMKTAVPMALAQEVQECPARLYTTVDGDEPAWYDVEIA